MEFHVALLGGPGTGKTSLLRKITKNYTDDINEDENQSVASISQEMMKHSLTTESGEEISVVFVSDIISEQSLFNLFISTLV